MTYPGGTEGIATVGGALTRGWLASFPSWALVFGMTAPPSTQVAQRLQVAARWSGLLASTEAWYAR